MFKVGDKVKIRRDSEYALQSLETGLITIDSGKRDGGHHPYTVVFFGGYSNSYRENDLELIESVDSKGIIMGLKESFALLLKSEPEKSFRKVGLTNGDDQLTPEGQAVFLTWLLKKHGDEFKKDVVDPILEAQKKDKCDC